MKIAVIGSGGREHAIAWKLMQADTAAEVFVLPGNGGIPNSVPMDPNDFTLVEQFCREKGVELVVIGPEAQLAKGIVDHFRVTDIKVFGTCLYIDRVRVR